jgi:hypothetical protein
VRERGTQSRRLRPGPPDRARRPVSSSEEPGYPSTSRSDGVRAWQIVAIVAIIAATAGWTATAMLVMRGPGEAAVPVISAAPTDDLGAIPSDDSSIPPLDLTHDVPALEPLLPSQVSDTPLVSMSWTGDAIFSDDGWSTTMTKYLADHGKTPADLQAGQAMDPNQALDLVVRVFRVDGLAPADILSAMIDGWRVDYPDMVVSQATIGGKAVTKGDFGSEGVNSYWYIQGDHVFDVETSDETIAAAALAAIPPSAPAGSPAGSVAPSASTPPTALPSPS